jgi:hypothetical protein
MDQSLDNAPGVMPPPELVQQWMDAPHGLGLGCHPARSVPDATYAKRLIEAAQWGANQELEACCEWISTIAGKKWSITTDLANSLHATRRPKPPSLKEQAIAVLDDAKLDRAHYNILLRALEQLDD